ncbi:hypothetical protein D4764_03G0001230 [Takifugu flavidus]|uniref:Reverse transcriptase domain-containing protein n=1 Tax=Takifugu flavidus TaxID=433684 RepID=A0A5C6N7M1_9TELE|nr:hypothetical protein D4764_03G0001230 [Takifugu flavidus]
MLLDKLRKAEVMSLAVDESIDNSDVAQLSLYVQFFDGECFCEDLLGLIPLEGKTTGEILFTKIAAFFEENNLNFGERQHAGDRWCTLNDWQGSGTRRKDRSHDSADEIVTLAHPPKPPLCQTQWIGSLLFADDVVLLASSARDLQRSLDRFATACEVAGMRISTSKSEAMVLNWKKVKCLLQVKEEILPQVEEFKYLRVLFTSEGRIEQEIDRRIGAASAVIRILHQSVVMKRELSQKAKLSICQSIFVPILTKGHEVWVMTERTRSQGQAAEISFFCRVAGLFLRDRVRSSAIWEELGVEPLLLRVERSQMRWLGHLVRMPLGRLPDEVFRACPSGRRPPERPWTRWREYVSRLVWEHLGIPPERAGRSSWGKGSLGLSA